MALVGAENIKISKKTVAFVRHFAGIFDRMMVYWLLLLLLPSFNGRKTTRHIVEPFLSKTVL